MPSSRVSSQPRDRTHVSCLLHQHAGSLPLVPPGKPPGNSGERYKHSFCGSPLTQQDSLTYLMFTECLKKQGHIPRLFPSQPNGRGRPLGFQGWSGECSSSPLKQEAWPHQRGSVVPSLDKTNCGTKSHRRQKLGCVSEAPSVRVSICGLTCHATSSTHPRASLSQLRTCSFTEASREVPGAYYERWQLSHRSGPCGSCRISLPPKSLYFLWILPIRSMTYSKGIKTLATLEFSLMVLYVNVQMKCL